VLYELRIIASLAKDLLELRRIWIACLLKLLHDLLRHLWSGILRKLHRQLDILLRCTALLRRSATHCSEQSRLLSLWLLRLGHRP